MTTTMSTPPSEQRATASLRHVIKDVIEDETLMRYLDSLAIFSVQGLMATSLRDLQHASWKERDDDTPQTIAPGPLGLLIGFKALVVWRNSSDQASERIGIDYEQITAEHFEAAMCGMPLINNKGRYHYNAESGKVELLWGATSIEHCLLDEDETIKVDADQETAISEMAATTVATSTELAICDLADDDADKDLCDRSGQASVKVLTWGDAWYDSTFTGAGTERKYIPEGTARQSSDKVIPRHAHARVDDHGHVGMGTKTQCHVQYLAQCHAKCGAKCDVQYLAQCHTQCHAQCETQYDYGETTHGESHAMAGSSDYQYWGVLS